MINKALNLCFHSLLFLVVFNSALKYIYSVNLWNMLQLFLALCLIVLGSIYKDRVYRGISVIALIFILFISFLTSLSFFYSLASFDMNDIFKFITLTIFMFSGLYFAQYLNVLPFVKVLNVFTFLFILIFDFLKLMKMDPNANYLMYSMAISFVCVANLGISYFRGWDFKWLIIGVILLLYCLILHSRAAIIFPIIFLMFFVFCYCLKENKMLKFFSSMLIVFAIGLLVLSLYDVTIEDFSNLGYGAYKLIGMLQSEYSDDRGSLLRGSLQAIYTNPFGYGIGSYEELLGFYPHNFFLEVMLSFGVFVCLIYILVLVFAIYELYMAKEMKLWFFSLLYLYYLAIWMSSFDYLSSFQIHFALGGFVSCFLYRYKVYQKSQVPIKIISE
jgi:hypothetical protein